jgi:hypothetical protein
VAISGIPWKLCQRPAELRHRPHFAEQAFHRGGAERHQCPRLDDIDLLLQVWKAGLHLVRARLPIARFTSRHVGAALQDVCDVDSLPSVAHRGDDFRQQLTSLADKWLTLQVLVFTGSFADKHQLRLWIANAEDHLRARAHQMRTQGAGERRFAHRGEALRL